MEDFAPSSSQSSLIVGCIDNEFKLSEMKLKRWVLFNNRRIRHHNAKFFNSIKKDLKKNGISKLLLIDLAWLDRYMRVRKMIHKTTFPGNVHITYREAMPELDITTSVVCYEITISEGIEIKIMINTDLNKDTPIIVKWEVTTINNSGGANTTSAEISYRDKISMDTMIQKAYSTSVRTIATAIPELVEAKLKVMLHSMEWYFACTFMDFSNE